MKQSYALSSPEQTRALGRLLAELAEPGTTLALDGPLGAGKTCLAQGVGEGLGVQGPVTSPTFQILAEHQGPEGVLYHADLYRLEDPRELQELGLEELLGVDGVSVVEWASRFEQVLPVDRLDIHIEHAGPDARHATLSARGPASTRLLQALSERMPPEPG